MHFSLVLDIHGISFAVEIAALLIFLQWNIALVGIVVFDTEGLKCNICNGSKWGLILPCTLLFLCLNAFNNATFWIIVDFLIIYWVDFIDIFIKRCWLVFFWVALFIGWGPTVRAKTVFAFDRSKRLLAASKRDSLLTAAVATDLFLGLSITQTGGTLRFTLTWRSNPSHDACRNAGTFSLAAVFLLTLHGMLHIIRHRKFTLVIVWTSFGWFSYLGLYKLILHDWHFLLDRFLTVIGIINVGKIID